MVSYHDVMEMNDKEADKIISEFKKAGIIFEKGKRIPKNGRYTGVIGKSNKILKLNIDGEL